MKNPLSAVSSFKHIHAFLDNSRCQITMGEIPPIRRDPRRGGEGSACLSERWYR
jgi:hypothetical protein